MCGAPRGKWANQAILSRSRAFAGGVLVSEWTQGRTYASTRLLTASGRTCEAFSCNRAISVVGFVGIRCRRGHGSSGYKRHAKHRSTKSVGGWRVVLCVNDKHFWQRSTHTGMGAPGTREPMFVHVCRKQRRHMPLDKKKSRTGSAWRCAVCPYGHNSSGYKWHAKHISTKSVGGWRVVLCVNDKHLRQRSTQAGMPHPGMREPMFVHVRRKQWRHMLLDKNKI